MPKHKKVTSIPAITRVHNLHRIRTVVNAVTTLNSKGKLPRDVEIGKVLAKTHLSKLRKTKINDRIMRRARDHLLTATYMGLLTRMKNGRRFGYISTTAGKRLQKYKFFEECPKDENEMAVFIDRILRLKLTNVYDLQFRKTYANYRSRPCLHILHILRSGKWLHEHQIAVAESGRVCDPAIENRATVSLVKTVVAYDIQQNKDAIYEFYRDFSISDYDKKNLTRNIRPLLNWMESLALIRSKEIEDVNGKLYSITNSGTKILELYENRYPIWFDDLGGNAEIKSAIILISQYSRIKDIDIKNFLKKSIKLGTKKLSLSKVIADIERSTGLQLSRDSDFTFEYDIPPEQRKVVHSLISKLTKQKNKNILGIIHDEQLEQLKRIIHEEQQSLGAQTTESFASSTRVSITRIKKMLPSIGVLSQYRSDFEKETALLLNSLKIKAIKYQGQVANETTKTFITRFFENNPDILIADGIKCLVECKSIYEWKTPLTVNKNVAKEIQIYQLYMKDLRVDSTLFVYEGALSNESYRILKEMLSESTDIVFVTKNYLLNCISKPSLRQVFIQAIKRPRRFDAEQRILKV